MQRAMKFGRRLPMPSSVQIKHDLKLMAAADTLVEAVRTKDCTAKELSLLISELTGQYRISPDRAQRLSDRFGAEQKAAPIVAS